MGKKDHLIILPCHSIWTPGPTLGDSRDEWHLANFQVEGYDHLCFKDHIIRSLQILREDPSSTLIISGGQTKKEAGVISEALSYYQLSLRMNAVEELVDRITTEEFARDSFENVLFLICRYYELHGKYPQRITVVGFEFKKKRFVDEHLKNALLFKGPVVYIGNMPFPKDADNERLRSYFVELNESEDRHALRHFKKDWYGLKLPLSDKKMKRNPFNRFHGYNTSNPPLSEFLEAIHLKNPHVAEEDFDDYNESVRLILEKVSW